MHGAKRASATTASSSSSPTRTAALGRRLDRRGSSRSPSRRVAPAARAVPAPGGDRGGSCRRGCSQVIAATYAALEQIDPSPIVRLNRAVAVALAGDVEEGLALIDGIEGLDGYSYLPAARADLLRRLDRHAEAAASYREALALTDNAPERRFLERRLRDVGG